MHRISSVWICSKLTTYILNSTKYTTSNHFSLSFNICLDKMFPPRPIPVFNMNYSHVNYSHDLFPLSSTESVKQHERLKGLCVDAQCSFRRAPTSTEEAATSICLE